MRGDHITPRDLDMKMISAVTTPLRIACAGPADVANGAFHWIKTLEQLATTGTDFQAIWLGDGPALAEMRARVAASGLRDRIHLPGAPADRATLLTELRRAHLFLFCHRILGSPRDLIDALISGCPLIGYDSALARDLVAIHRGGLFVPAQDISALASLLGTLNTDRTRLMEWIGRAACDGAPLDSETLPGALPRHALFSTA